MSSYIGKYAEYYDLIYADKPYKSEAAFLNDCIEKYGKPEASKNLLELACGSGRHALEFENLGYKVLATDYSEDLLRVAKRRAKEAGSEVDFSMADMRELDLPEKNFNTALCLFDSIGYVQTDQAVKKVLENVRDHLVNKGLFLFEFWHAEAMLNHYEPFRVRKWPLPNGKLLRISETELIPEDGLARVAYEIYELRNDLSYSMIKEIQINRYFSIDEMAAFLEGAAFEALAWLNGYTWDEQIDDTSWHVLCIARAN